MAGQSSSRAFPRAVGASRRLGALGALAAECLRAWCGQAFGNCWPQAARWPKLRSLLPAASQGSGAGVCAQGLTLLLFLLGFVGHSPTKARAPAYTFRGTKPPAAESCGPGPCYFVQPAITRNGKHVAPSAHLCGRPTTKTTVTPGPSEYHFCSASPTRGVCPGSARALMEPSVFCERAQTAVSSDKHALPSEKDGCPAPRAEGTRTPRPKRTESQGLTGGTARQDIVAGHGKASPRAACAPQQSCSPSEDPFLGTLSLRLQETSTSRLSSSSPPPQVTTAPRQPTGTSSSAHRCSPWPSGGSPCAQTALQVR